MYNRINMKKLILISLTLAFLSVSAGITPAQAQTKATGSKATVAKTTAVKKTVKTTAVKPAPKPVVVSVKWAASGLQAVSRVPKGVRPAYKKKVENYARRNKIKLITKAVVASMRE